MAATHTELGITVLGSGSAGNATLIQTGKEAILIDAGFSARELRRRLDMAGVDHRLIRGIILSHEHSDHVRGVRVCASQLGIPIFSNRETATALRYREKRDLGELSIFGVGSPFQVGEFAVEPFSIPHDANDPVGFVVRCAGRKVGVATDLGHASHLVCYQLRECDLLIVESNHDVRMLSSSSRPWSLKQRILGRHGHLSNQASMELLKRVIHARTRHLVLAHASQECNRYELVEAQVAQCLSELERQDIASAVARQDRPLPTIWL